MEMKKRESKAKGREELDMRSLTLKVKSCSKTAKIKKREINHGLLQEAF